MLARRGGRERSVPTLAALVLIIVIGGHDDEPIAWTGALARRLRIEQAERRPQQDTGGTNSTLRLQTMVRCESIDNARQKAR